LARIPRPGSPRPSAAAGPRIGNPVRVKEVTTRKESSLLDQLLPSPLLQSRRTKFFNPEYAPHSRRDSHPVAHQIGRCWRGERAGMERGTWDC